MPKLLKDLKTPEEVINFLREHLKNTKEIKKSDFDDIIKKLNNSLRYMPKSEQERIKEVYKYEIEFLNGITDRNVGLPSVYISKNHDLLNKILNNESVIKEQEKQEPDIQPDVVDTQEKINTTTEQIPSKYKQEDELNTYLEQLKSLQVEYGSKKSFMSGVDLETISKEELTKILAEFEDLEGRVKPVYDYFHNGAGKFNKNKKENEEIAKKYSFFEDQKYEAFDMVNELELVNAILNFYNSGNYIEDDVDDIHQIDKVKEHLKQLKSKAEKYIGYYQGRYDYYNEHLPDDENKENKLKEIAKKIDSCKKGLLDKVIPEITENDISQDEIEESVFETEQETVNIDEEEKVFHEHLENYNYDIEEQEGKLDDFEFDELSEKNASINLDEVPDNNRAFVEEDIGIISDEEFYEEFYNKSNSEEQEVIDVVSEEIEIEEIEQPEVEESSKSINDETVTSDNSEVAKRVIKMLSGKDVTSLEKINSELDNLYKEMLEPKKKRELFVKKRKMSFGNINEDLYMNIRSVFSKINVKSKYLDEPYADEFAKKIFVDGVPQYMNGDMDEKTSNEFLSGVSKYIEMSESDMFTQSEKDNFEKFVIQPYMLKSVSRNEKDLGDKLKEDTFSPEDIIKNASSRSSEEINKKRNVSKVK